MNQQGPYQTKDIMSLLLNKGPMRIVVIIVGLLMRVVIGRRVLGVGMRSVG